MKKTFKTMLALMAGAMVFTACSNDDITENIPQQIPSALKPMTFTASMEGEAGATRAAIDGLDIKWEGTDKISIFDGATENNGDQEFTLTDGDGTTSGTFTGTAAEATTYYALYPYVESKNSSREVTREEAKAAVGDNDLSDDWTLDLVVGHYEDFKGSIESEFSEYGISPENQAIYIAYLKQEPLTVKSGPQRNASDQFENVVLPAAQTATAGSADPNAMLMIGTSTDATTLEFKNVCAYVKVTPSFACSSIVLRSNSTESLAGTMTVGLDTDGNPTTTVTNGTNMVTLSGTIAANSTYYIAVRPETLANGFTIYFKTADGRYMKSTSKTVTLTRSKVLNLGSFDITDLTADHTIGTATRTGGSVNWVQLWADGPKFAEYNVGAANNKAEDYGDYYAWGGEKVVDGNQSPSYNTGSVDLAGDTDTANQIWGSNWRMPTNDEFWGLINNCAYTLINDYNGTGINGMLVTGKGDYALNNIFFPTAGYYFWGSNNEQGNKAQYWTSSSWSGGDAIYMQFGSGDFEPVTGKRIEGNSIRPVLAE